MVFSHTWLLFFFVCVTILSYCYNINNLNHPRSIYLLTELLLFVKVLQQNLKIVSELLLEYLPRKDYSQAPVLYPTLENSMYQCWVNAGTFGIPH